ncbi:hypothetical protein Glove_115g115 [Diversispora epigaea]|uniref:Uncharacterized protein n=1 Tax=Diversispora epigaea TaxID=1348612 RepID=A0A397J7I0_9GLOM|nr:hypothetical protein Glove_115g115 [Diversispora epigaea]
MRGEYTCEYIHNSGEVCGCRCRKPEGCHEHWKAKKRVLCICGKGTASAPGIFKECYDILHSKINNNDNTIWCGRILDRLWTDLFKASSEQITFVISLCEFFLNPKNEDLKNDNKYLQIITNKNNKNMKNDKAFSLETFDSDDEIEEEENELLSEQEEEKKK